MDVEGRLVNSTEELKAVVNDYENQGYERIPVEADDRAIVVKRREAEAKFCPECGAEVG